MREALEKILSELCVDIYDRGIVLIGGGALLRNLDHRLRDDIGLLVLVVENPFTFVVFGVGMMLLDMELLRCVVA